MNEMRFSGHDTFHCRQQWLLKGLELIVKEGVTGFNDTEKATTALGVGKNMVQSIHHWLKAFALVNKNQISPIADLIFLENGGYDKYLEDEGSLWLLQYLICKNEVASIFKIIFSEFFKEKVSIEFTETQVLNFIQQKLKNNFQKEASITTLKSDFKAFINSYLILEKNFKTIEDDFNSPLIELNLVSVLERKYNGKDSIYKINKGVKNNIPVSIFGYCLFDANKNNSAVNFKDIRLTLGSYFALSNEGLENLVEQLCQTYPEFIYNDDAGTRQIQIKSKNDNFGIKLLNDYYGL